MLFYLNILYHPPVWTHSELIFLDAYTMNQQNNIMGTHVLLESAKIAKISRFIHVSTDEVYGEQTLDQEAMSEEQVQITFLYSFLFFILIRNNAIISVSLSTSVTVPVYCQYYNSLI